MRLSRAKTRDGVASSPGQVREIVIRRVRRGERKVKRKGNLQPLARIPGTESENKVEFHQTRTFGDTNKLARRRRYGISRVGAHIRSDGQVFFPCEGPLYL